MAEPEFCSTFVKELGVSNLISICKVRNVMFVLKKSLYYTRIVKLAILAGVGVTTAN